MKQSQSSSQLSWCSELWLRLNNSNSNSSLFSEQWVNWLDWLDLDACHWTRPSLSSWNFWSWCRQVYPVNLVPVNPVHSQQQLFNRAASRLSSVDLVLHPSHNSSNSSQHQWVVVKRNKTDRNGNEPQKSQDKHFDSVAWSKEFLNRTFESLEIKRANKKLVAYQRNAR